MGFASIHSFITLPFRVILVLLLLSACGGGGGGGSGGDGSGTNPPGTYTVTIDLGANGTSDLTGTATVDENGTVTLNLVADSNYSIDSVTGCGGVLSGSNYTTGAITADCTVTVTFIIDSYTVTIDGGSNGSVSQTSATVNHDDSTSFTITPDTGFNIGSASGCNGTRSGNTYTTGAITADCTVTVSFTTPVVEALFPTNGSNWNDYVGGSDFTLATDTACDTVNDTICMQGGEHRVVRADFATSCDNLTATDALGAFNWVCDDSTGSVRLVSTGLKKGKGLSDLVNFTTPAFLNNSVTLLLSSAAVATTPGSAWWSNTVVASNSGGTLAAPSVIHLVTADVAGNYVLDAAKMALVIEPGRTLSSSSTDRQIEITTNGDHSWVEGKIDAGTGGTLSVGIETVDGGDFSRFQNIEIRNGIFGLAFTDGTRGNQVVDVRNIDNLFNSLSLDGNHNRIIDSTLGQRVQFQGSKNVVSNVLISNSEFEGLRRVGIDPNNVISMLTVHNNATSGIRFESNQASIVSIATTASNNSLQGIETLNENSTWLNVLSVNNGTVGFQLSAEDIQLADVVVAHNATGIQIDTFGNNSSISGTLRLGNNTNDCSVDVGATNPGLDNSCAPQGDSDFGTAITGIDLTNSFVGKVQTDDTTNTSDTDGGAAAFPANPESFDWSNFDNPFRGWGIDGSAFPNTDHLGNWATGAGRIWDWSLAIGDSGNGGSPAVLGVLPLPNGNDTVTHGWDGTPATNDDAGCQAVYPDSRYSATNSACETTFLLRAVEVMRDARGNENALCESGEICLYTPNIGAYQGHGNLISAGTFVDGELTGITLLKYENNGR